ncbi:MAG: NTP/NDP exchange transporter, partial [Rickettsiaceae bacterium]|nr:NTP/NDP exchange transporter [Rickettsiaceae bacterium]
MNLAQIRNIVWPIENRELKKFLPMAFFMFCVLFNYSMLRSIKDGLVVTGVGAEALSFLKLAFVLPSSILFFFIYAKASSRFSAQQLFYIITGFFAGYFLLFAFLLYPNTATIHPNPINVDYWAEQFPVAKWFIKIGGKWIYASFYVMAELWGSVMLSFLFWWVANDITKTSEAKRFYPLFGMLGNFGLILTSLSLEYLVSKNPEDEGTEFNIVLILLVISCLSIMLIYNWINNNVITDSNLYQKDEKVEKKKKAKLSVIESLKLILTSRYLGLIALLIFSYGISQILIEGVWKNQINQLYPSKAEYAAYMGRFQGLQGVATILFMLVGNNILRLTSWRFAASLTPLMILITGIAF